MRSRHNESGGPRRHGFGEGWRAALATGTLVVGLAACDAPSEPQVPGGGRSLPLDRDVFAARVEPVLQARGCSNMACHGGQGAGMLMLSGGSDVDADFVNASPHTRPWEPPSSPLVRKPLAAAAGGLVHGGGVVFADTSDADYRTLLAWIAGGTAP
jgi:hypothetical protein